MVAFNKTIIPLAMLISKNSFALAIFFLNMFLFEANFSVFVYYLPSQVSLCALKKATTLQFGWLQCSIYSPTDVIKATFLEQEINPIVHLQVIQSPTDQLAPSKYEFDFSSRHVMSEKY